MPNLTVILNHQNELFRNKANSLNAIVDRARELKEKNEQLETQMLVNEEEKKVASFESNEDLSSGMIAAHIMHWTHEQALEAKIAQLHELCENTQKV